MPQRRSGLETGILLGIGIGLWLLERALPLRRNREPVLRRQARNLGVAGVAAAALSVAGAPVILPLTRFVERRRFGLFPMLQLPRWLATALALLAKDYTFYWWHRMAHKSPLVWRFHVAHHADLDLDASTALRFHFGELLLGVPFQAAQVLVIGIDRRTYSLWQTLFLAAILFHHSNWRLPLKWERRLALFLVTPRMHGIHHSTVQEETDSNWSSGLNVWDRLHGTLRLNVPQQAVDIGVPAYRSPRQVSFERTLLLPFADQPDSWTLPSGEQPEPHEQRMLPVLLEA